jgi:hypothetical protein
MAINTFARPRLLAVAAAGFVAVGLVALPAYAAVTGPGTWTRITTPTAGTSILSQFGHEGQLRVKGKASADVSSVNVYCLIGSGTSVDATTVATTVPVTSGTFSSTVPVPSGLSAPRCRLRALPTGVNPQTTYLASYAGPEMNFDSWKYASSSDTFNLQSSSGDGTLEASGVGFCGQSFLGTVLLDESVPGGSDGCVLALDQPGPGATRSTVQVDGHDAYTSSAALGFGLTPTRLSVNHFHLWHGSGVRWTESMPIDRCASDVSFPPGAGSCPSLVSSGVELHQVSTYLPSGHQVQVRTELRSLDGKRHHLALRYDNFISAVGSGDIGYRLPGQQSFHASTPGTNVTDLGSGSGTMLARDDRHSVEGDPGAATRAITWSRTPSRVSFSFANGAGFALDYRLTVPRKGGVHLGFADSDSPLTSRSAALGRRGEADMMSSPRIASPTKGAGIKGRTTKVTGVVKAGANGLPTSVRVNGHAAKLKPSKSGARARFTVTFTEPLGKHTLKAVAKDAVGNKRSSTVEVTNK